MTMGAAFGVPAIAAASCLFAGPVTGQQASEVHKVPEVTRSGADLFRQYCAACHGPAGRGDGPVAAHMKRRPPDLTLFAVRNDGFYSTTLMTRIIDGRVIVKGHGGPDMPVWGDAFKASAEGHTDIEVRDRVAALVEHIGRIQRPKP